MTVAAVSHSILIRAIGVGPVLVIDTVLHIGAILLLGIRLVLRSPVVVPLSVYVARSIEAPVETASLLVKRGQDDGIACAIHEVIGRGRQLPVHAEHASRGDVLRCSIEAHESQRRNAETHFPSQWCRTTTADHIDVSIEEDETAWCLLRCKAGSVFSGNVFGSV